MNTVLSIFYISFCIFLFCTSYVVPCFSRCRRIFYTRIPKRSEGIDTLIVTLSTFQDTCTLKCAVWATTKMLHLSPVYVLGVEGHQSRPTKAAVGAFRTSCCDFRWPASIVKRPASFQPT